ncbi:MAG: hypothetical protein WAV41_05425 [Microgenomates group bacterium]
MTKRYDVVAIGHLHQQIVPHDFNIIAGMRYPDVGIEVSDIGLIRLDKRIRVASVKRLENDGHFEVRRGKLGKITLPPPRTYEGRIEFLSPDESVVSITFPRKTVKEV